MPNNFAPYSYSKISMYHQCPRKFKYAIIDKLKGIQTDDTALIKGRAIHSFLENYPVRIDISPEFEAAISAFIQSDFGKAVLNKPSTREYKFGLDRYLNPCDFWDKAVFIRGLIDHISVCEDTVHLIDYKTGKYKDEKYQSFDQLLVYAIYFFNKYKKIDKIKISYVYVEHNLENSMLLERQFLDNYTNQLQGLISPLENDQSFNKNVSKLCGYCQFRDICINN